MNHLLSASPATTAFLVASALSSGFRVAAAQEPHFVLAGHDVAVVGDLGAFELSVEVERAEPGVEIAHLRLRSPSPNPPPPFSLRWSLPSRDVRGYWTTAAGLRKTLNPDWAPSRVRSALARGAPVLTLFGTDDGNRLTYAVSDALNSVELQAAVREEDARIYGGISFFRERRPAVRAVALEVRFDTRRVPFFRALRDVSGWWEEHPGYEPARVPDAARWPMYSTWYSYHQRVRPEALLPEVEAAKALGYDAIIVDDGWQTLDSHRGYAYTGDWKPERIPDMKGFVDAVHRRGMRFLLWYAVPLVGERARVYPRFRGRYLRYWNGQGAYELDPRYPEVREHVIDTYRKALREWGVDGFKLDFLGRFVANDSTVLEATDGRDYASVNAATDRLMSDIMAELRSVRPDVMIEFRQPYIGPLMRKYGNMFRAGDAPNSVVDNRVRIVDLRLLSGRTAVHSDMLMWHPDEPVEAAALQLLNVLFSVPQLSVRLGEISGEQREMVRFWTGYWRDNRSVLLDGAFEPRDPLANYPLVMGYDDRKLIAAAYGDVVVPLGANRPTARVDVVNATLRERIVVDAPGAPGRYRFRVRDTVGRIVREGVVDFDGGPRAFSVPPAGLLALERLASGGG